MTGLDQLPRTDPTSILRHRDGIYAADLLTAAVTEFSFFNYLRDHPGTIEDVCDHFQWADRPTDVLITLCKANRYLHQREDGTLFLTALAKEHLCDDSPWDLTGYYTSLRDRPVVEDFVKVLKSGRPAHWSGLDEAEGDWHGAMLNEDFAKTFTSAMDCRGVYLGKRLADAVGEWTDHGGPLLDIGGGSGVYSCAIAANNPHLIAYVLEQEPVDAIARKQIENRGLSDRVEVEVGNMFSDPWPSDCEIHLFSNVMHDWDVPEIVKLLRRSRETISEKGIVLIHETFLNAEKTGPLPVAEYSCILAHSTQGRCYSVAEIEACLEHTGFRMIAHRETGGDRSVIIGEAC